MKRTLSILILAAGSLIAQPVLLVNHTWAGHAGTATTTPVTCAGSSLAVAVVTDYVTYTHLPYVPGPVVSIPSNSWQLADSRHDGGNSWVSVFYAQNVNPGATLSLSYSGYYPSIAMTCWRNMAVTDVLASVKTAHGASPLSVGPLTGSPGDLVILGVADDEASADLMPFKLTDPMGTTYTVGDYSPLIPAVNEAIGSGYGILAGSSTLPAWTGFYSGAAVGAVFRAGSPGLSPVISAITTARQVAISWQTDVPASSQVAYGPTSAYGSISPLDTTLVSQHSLALVLGTGTWHYKVISAISSGGSSSSSDQIVIVP